MKKQTIYLMISIITIILFAILCIPTNVDATDINPNLYIGIKEFREGTTPDAMGYAINNPIVNQSDAESKVGEKIWKLVKYSDNTDTNADTSTTFYCVKAGIGFTDTNTRAVYNKSYDFLKERTAINNTNNKTLQSIVTTESDVYWGIVALADLMYIPESSTEQDKIKLLIDAGIFNNAEEAEEALKDEEKSKLIPTKDDIDAVQQAAFWYYTNSDDAELYEKIYNKYNKDNWFFYRTEEMAKKDYPEDVYRALSDYEKAGGENKGAGYWREEFAKRLYNYLIGKSQENISNYKNGTMVSKNKITLYTNGADENLDKANTQPIIVIEKNKPFDLALRKYITKVGDVVLADEGQSRNPVIDESTIAENGTATYKHKKQAYTVKPGDIITYNITIYNEGEKEGRANKIIDQLPEGLKFKQLNTEGYDVSQDEEANAVQFERKEDNKTNLKAYEKGKLEENSETLEFECEVLPIEGNLTEQKILTNVAWIAEEYNAEDNLVITNTQGDDRDSTPDLTPPDIRKDNMSDYKGTTTETDLSKNIYYPGYEDDDDFEKLVIMPSDFDLRLIKNVMSVLNNGDKEFVDVQNRIIGIDLTPLKEGTSSDIDIRMNKEPLLVKKGNIVKYRIRVYNEGDIDGYASEISENIPEGLELLWSEKLEDELKQDSSLSQAEIDAILYNQLIWTPKEINNETKKIEMVTTNYLAKDEGQEKVDKEANLIKAFNPTKEYIDTEQDKNPDYKEVYIYMKVVAEKANGIVIRNEAAITGDTDANGNDIVDRDSQPENWPGKEPEHKYQDDEDYDQITLQSFDLALRKFITQVKDQAIDTRIPKVKYDKEKNKITYEHSKEPIEVVTNDEITYTIRVFNEGQQDGYAAEITDDIPEGLEFLPNNDTNKEYGWVMIDKDGNPTEALSDAVKITTNYLSKEQGEKRAGGSESNPALLKAFDENAEISELNPSHLDVKVVFKVKETNAQDKTIINSAQISKDTDSNGNEVDDEDSIPGEWNEGEDDQDREFIKLTYFDLSLKKWVTHAIVVENGKETVTQTGHTPDQNPEPIVKVEVHRNKLDSVTVKFRFSIRVTNEGDIAGYAKEITDYIPEGLKFVQADNAGWTDAGNNMITTNLLADKLLQPGESADIQVVLTWINGSSNMGLKTNVAEITKDYNDKGAPDRDSTPGNRQPGEDDMDEAPVMLSIKTGKIQTYIILGLSVLVVLAGGITLIKKYVL